MSDKRRKTVLGLKSNLVQIIHQNPQIIQLKETFTIKPNYNKKQSC
jgi:hypothetical protein